MAKISVIIVAYNVEKYIAETLNSAVSQTLKDIEIVVVDDCSTDGTFEIISKYAELDKRIKVIRHEENKSANRARITGFKNSSGEYVMYVDGDDMLSPDACEKAYSAITEEDVDMLGFDMTPQFISTSPDDESLEKNLRDAMRSIEHKVVSISKAGLLDEKAVGGVINFTIWNKIYKRSLLEKASAHVPDEYLNMAEDALYAFLIQYHAKSYSCISDKLYNYRFGCGISTVSALSDRQINAFSKMAFIYDYLSGWVKNVNSEKECEGALQRIYKQTYCSIVDVYIHRVPKEQKEFFISEVLKCGSADMLVLAFSEQQYNNSVTPERIANECAGLDIFKAEKTTAKTIGAYYFRVYNGGVENVISSLTDIWVKSGYNVVLFTDEEPNENDYYINPSIKRVVVPAMKSRDFFNRKNRIEVFKKALIENEVDVMVYNAWNSPDLLLDEMIIKSSGVNLVVHMHSQFCCEMDNDNGFCAYYYSVLPKLFAFADSVVAITDVDNAWWQTVGLRSFKTRNPIQFKMDTETARLNGNNILFVGRISEEKKVIDAIMVAELVRKEIPDTRLTVVGKGDDRAYIQSVDDYIAKNELNDLVDMVGFKSDVIPYYQSADVMLCTSRIEGSPISWLESKICGVPLVSYELPNVDAVRESKGMIVVEHSDIKGAADAIVKILKDEALKKEMGRAARESAEDFLSLDLAEHWKNIFKETLVPKQEPLPLHKLSATETAVRMAVERYSSGILKRAKAAQYANYQSARADALECRVNELEIQIKARLDELERFKHSESYRVGYILTFIPRKIKALLKKILRRG